MLGITVKEALCLPSMADAVLIGGEAGLERIIQSVNIMEVPDIEAFIQPAELLVTTAYPIRDNLNALENLIPELNSRQLAALAIKPHRYISEIPAFMIDQANQLGFPLIQLPQHASFNEIINPILTEILNQQAAILARNEQISKELINIMLHGGGLDEIARTLASLLGLPVSIHGPAFKRMASWLTPRDFGPENNRLLSEIVSDQKRLLNAAKQKVPWSLYGENGGCDAHCLPVAVAGETYGYLFIWEPEKPLSERELTSVEHAVTVIALEISKKRAVFEVEARFKSNFIGALVDGEINTSEEAVTRAEKFGWQISEGFSALLFEMPGLHVKDSADALAARNKKIRMFEALNSIVSSFTPGSAVVESGTRILVLHRPQKREMYNQEIKSSNEILAKTCLNDLKKQFDLPVFVGISRFIKDPLQMREGINQARRALELGRRSFRQKHVFHIDDLGVYRILATSDGGELGRFLKDILEPLLAYDRQNETNLIDTLEVILEYDLNLQRAAKEMFIHYNTLRYRFQRIQEIIDLDLRIPENRLSVQLAMKIFHMRDIGKQ